MSKDFWLNEEILVLGGGSWGSVLANLAAPQVKSVKLWVRTEEHARQINSTRGNARYFKKMTLPSNITAVADLDRAFESEVKAIVWALPSSVSRVIAKRVTQFLKGDEILIHATKGVEQGSLKRISEVLEEEMPIARIGVLSGPNLAAEISQGKPAATVVASKFDEVIRAGKRLLQNPKFKVEHSNDMIGVEWAGTLKNVLAIAAGALESAELGWNARSVLMAEGLSEMVRFGEAMGAEKDTFLGLAGIGDLLATCTPLSRNYRVGLGLGQNKNLDQILSELGSTAEGVATARHVAEFSRDRQIKMPITDAVDLLIQNKIKASELLGFLS